jgi:hypothetical protein
MNWLQFNYALLRRDEALLQRESVKRPELLASVADKTVAIVGNARSLSTTALGPDIDACDIVVRLNAAPIPQQLSHGARTDWLAISTPVKKTLVKQRNPHAILWMTRKRRKMPFWILNDPGFFLNGAEHTSRLRSALGGAPTTGLMIIDLFEQSAARQINLFGFDFFASQSLSGRRTAAQVPHDFAAEKQYVDRLLARDPRFHHISTSP